MYVGEYWCMLVSTGVCWSVLVYVGEYWCMLVSTVVCW